MRMRRLMTGPAVAAALLLVGAACSSDDPAPEDAATATTTTTTSPEGESSGTTTTVAGAETPPADPEQVTPVSPAELAEELAGPAEDGDICGIADTFSRVSPDPTDGESYRDSLRVIYDAVAKVVPSLPAAVGDPLDVVLAKTAQMLTLLDSNGADITDQSFVALQNDPALQTAQLEFQTWLGENCS